jgi:hypothetical protein
MVTKKTTRKSVNKSQAIRDYINAHPNAGNVEVADVLSKQLKKKLSADYVSTIRSNTKRAAASGEAPKKRGRPPKVKTLVATASAVTAAVAPVSSYAPRAAASLGSATFTRDALVAARDLISSSGDVASARAALDAAAELFPG